MAGDIESAPKDFPLATASEFGSPIGLDKGNTSDPPTDAPSAIARQEPENTSDNDMPDADVDSALGDGLASSTVSLSPSIRQGRTLNGRSFHAKPEEWDANYWRPNDEKANEALDIVHYVQNLILENRLYLAPLEVKLLHKVLDVGTGTGGWAIDFAERHPQAEVIGTDISVIQPMDVPPNLKFEIDDCTLPWTFTPGSFSFIRMGRLFGSIEDWVKLFKEAFHALAPGGWLESHEPDCYFTSDDGTVNDETAIGQWGPLFREAGKKSKRSFTVVADNIQFEAMEAAGFINIQTTEYKTPLGDWPTDPQRQELGILSRMAMLDDAEGFLSRSATSMGWSEERVTVYAAELRNEVSSGNHHASYRQKVVYGQKTI